MECFPGSKIQWRFSFFVDCEKPYTLVESVGGL